MPDSILLLSRHALSAMQSHRVNHSCIPTTAAPTAQCDERGATRRASLAWKDREPIASPRQRDPQRCYRRT